MASGAQLRARMCQSPQLALLLASCFVLFELGLVTCPSLKDLRELLRSMGLQWCFSSSRYAHHPSMDSFISVKAGTALYTQIKTKSLSVCVPCTCVHLCEPKDPYRYMTTLTISLCFCLFPLLPTLLLHFHPPLPVLFHCGQATHTGKLRLCSGSVICTDKSV